MAGQVLSRLIDLCDNSCLPFLDKISIQAIYMCRRESNLLMARRAIVAFLLPAENAPVGRLISKMEISALLTFSPIDLCNAECAANGRGWSCGCCFNMVVTFLEAIFGTLPLGIQEKDGIQVHLCPSPLRCIYFVVATSN